eukprot:822380-Pleurochrysis_carterae.AAC.1
MDTAAVLGHGATRHAGINPNYLERRRSYRVHSGVLRCDSERLSALYHTVLTPSARERRDCRQISSRHEFSRQFGVAL